MVVCAMNFATELISVVDATGATGGWLFLCLPEMATHGFRFHSKHEKTVAIAHGWLCKLSCLFAVDDCVLIRLNRSNFDSSGKRSEHQHWAMREDFYFAFLLGKEFVSWCILSKTNIRAFDGHQSRSIEIVGFAFPGCLQSLQQYWPASSIASGG